MAEKLQTELKRSDSSADDELGGDPESIIRSYSSKLAEATLDPVWLANELCSERLLDTRTRNDLITTTGVSAHNKAIQLWSQMETIVKFQENPRQAFLTVCNVMKKRVELAPLAQTMTSQLKPHDEEFRDAHDKLPTKFVKTLNQPMEEEQSLANDSREIRAHLDLVLSTHVWFWLANLCFIVAILSDIVLVLEDSTWPKYFWAEMFPYSMLLALVLIGMTKPIKSFYLIGLLYILIFYELMCLSTFTDLLALQDKSLFNTTITGFVFVARQFHIAMFSNWYYVPYPRYDVLTATKWLAKSLCKIPLYMELSFYSHNNMNTNLHAYLAISYFTLVAFGFVHLFIYFFINKPNTVVVVTIMLIAVIGVPCGLTILNSREHTEKLTSTLFVVYGIFEIINSFIVYNITQSPDYFSLVKFIFYFVFSLLGFYTLLYIIDSSFTTHGTKGMKIAWMFYSVFSVAMYFLNITYHQIQFSFVIVILGILVIVSLYFIKSAYAVALIITLLVIYNISVLHETWSSNSSVFVVAQATSQLTVVGALLYTASYNYGRKINCIE